MDSQSVLKNPIVFLILIFTGLVTFHCTPDEEILDFDYKNGLSFSLDTILFDTVFTGVGSTTQRLQVYYNPNDKAIQISSIEVGRGGDSSFQHSDQWHRTLSASEDLFSSGQGFGINFS